MTVAILVGVLVFAKGISILLVFIHFDIMNNAANESLSTFFDTIIYEYQ